MDTAESFRTIAIGQGGIVRFLELIVGGREIIKRDIDQLFLRRPKNPILCSRFTRAVGKNYIGNLNIYLVLNIYIYLEIEIV